MRTYGIYADSEAWDGTDHLVIRDTEVNSAGGTSLSSAITFEDGASAYLDITSSKVWGHVAPETYGIRYGTGAVTLQGSSVVGFTNTVLALGNASIAATGLTGGPVSVFGWAGCMGVWDESGVFYANTCPS